MAKLQVVREVKNAVLYEDSEGQPYVRIDGARASYPFIGTPASDENDKGDTVKKWRIVLMLPKKTHGEAKELIVDLIKQIMKDNAKVPKQYWFITDGDEKDDENMEGHWLVSAADGKYRPKCRDADGHVIDDVDEIDNLFYGGCWVNALIRPWYFDGKSKHSKKPFPKRISAGISSVMFAKDDKPFGAGRIDDSDVWGDDDGMGDNDDDRGNRGSRNRRGRDRDEDDDDDDL